MSLPPDPTDTFRLLDVEVATVGRDYVLLYSRRTRETRLVPTTAALVLQQCQTFRTLEEHAHAAVRLPSHTGGANLEINCRWLEDFARGGFLISPRELQAMCARTTDPHNLPPRISTIGIPTHDRTELLLRALSSGLSNLQSHGREVTFVVMNDHPQREVQQECRQRLQAWRTETGAKIAYAGLIEKEVYFSALKAEVGCDPALLRFGLFNDDGFPFAVGANRNQLMLQTLGENLICMDDDVVCRVAEIPHSEPESRLAFCGAVRPERWFFADRESAWSSAQFVEKDLLALHEEFLGKDLGQCLERIPSSELDFQKIDGAFGARLGCGRGRVRVTFTGILGDPGLNPRQISSYLGYYGKTFQRLTATEKAYRMAMTSREVLSGVTRRTIGAGNSCAGMMMGWDNRSLLPPWFPFGRGEDTSWGTMVWTCSPETYFAHVPYALCHVPDPQKRTFSTTETWRDPPVTFLAHLLIGQILAHDWRPNHLSIPDRLRTLGQRLSEVGQMRPTDFDDLIRDQLWQRQTRYLEGMERRLQAQHGEPKFWADDVRFYLDQVRTAMQKPEYLLPHQLYPHHNLEESRLKTQTWLGKFGQFLQVWPEVVAAAQRLKARGQTLAQPV